MCSVRGRVWRNTHFPCRGLATCPVLSWLVAHSWRTMMRLSGFQEEELADEVSCREQPLGRMCLAMCCMSDANMGRREHPESPGPECSS
jgi:hypothetical protein